jgi:hypothetical protein
MPDNPFLRGHDAHTVSSQEYEIRYVVNQLALRFPRRSRADVEAAVRRAKASIQPSEGREKLMALAARLLA